MIRLDRARGVRALQALLVATFVLGAGEAAAQSTTPPPAPAKAAPSKGAKDQKPAPEAASASQANAAKTNATPTPEAKKEDEEEKEAARAIYLSVDAGFTRPDLGGFSNNLALDKTAANGVTWSVGSGLRLHDLKLGARWRVFDTTEFDLWSVMVEAGYALPIRPVSPGLTVHLGYIWDQSLNRPLFQSSLPGNRQTVLDPRFDVSGAIVGVEAQAMYWLNKYIRAGAFLGFDMLFLSRSQASLPGTTSPVSDEIRAKPLYTDTGSGVGYVFNVGLRGAFDVGF